jgi:hypothetical protein
MKKLLIIFLICIGVSFCANFGFIGAGARASGMGGTFIAIADDATSIFWNPAGLTHLLFEEISIIGRYESSNFSQKEGFFLPDAYSSFSLNFLSFAYPFKLGKRNVVIAASISSVYDFDFNPKIEGINPGFALIDKSSGKIYQILVGIAFDVVPGISFGISSFYHIGKRYIEEIEVNSENIIANGSTLTDNFSKGNGVSVGILINFSSLNIACVYKVPLSELEVNREITTFNNQTYNSSYDLKNRKINELTRALLPPTIGFGLSFSPSDVVQLGIDYNVVQWSKYRENGEMPKYQNGVPKFTDVVQFHFGIEIFIRKGLLNEYPTPLRFGIYTDPLPSQTEFEQGTSGTFFTLGTGFITKSGEIAISFEFGSREYPGRITENIIRSVGAIVYRL